MFQFFFTLEEMEEIISTHVEKGSNLFKIKMQIKEYYDFLVKRLKKPEKYIPHGIYCYDCPFKDCNFHKDQQENGYCYYLGEGDWEGDGIGLLWDGCKECDINWPGSEEEL